MAIVWRGLSPAALHSLPSHMRDSARVLRFSSLPGVKVDKHSSGMSILVGTRSLLETAVKDWCPNVLKLEGINRRSSVAGREGTFDGGAKEPFGRRRYTAKRLRPGAEAPACAASTRKTA